MQAPAKVLILGAGGIGGLLAARLSMGSHAHVYLGVRGATNKLAFMPEGREGPALRPDVTTLHKPDTSTRYDWIIVATKAHDTSSLSEWLRHPSCANATVAMAQNGIDHAARLSGVISPDRVVPLIVTYGAERPTRGVFVQTLDGVIQVPDSASGRSFAALADHAHLAVEIAPDFDRALWTKLAWNLVSNSLTTLTNRSVRDVGRSPELRSVGVRLLGELRVAASLANVEIAASLETAMFPILAAHAPSVRSSMWQDRRAGRRLEHEALSGAVARRLEATGRPAPYCRMITDLLASLSNEAGDWSTA